MISPRTIAAAALAIALIQAIAIPWYLVGRNQRLERELTWLRQDIAALEKNVLSYDRDDPNTLTGRERLHRALKHLDSKNLIRRYQAGLVIKEFGDPAAAELIQLLQTGSNRQKQAALLILSDVATSDHTPRLRAIADSALNAPSSDSPAALDSAQLAGLLGILGQLRDAQAKPIFRTALRHPEQAVQTAAVIGLRQLGDVQSAARIAELLPKADGLIERELRRTLRDFWRTQPEQFVQTLREAPPKARFDTVRLLADDPSAAARQALEQLTNDPDKRVAAAAKHLLQNSNSPQ